MNEFYTYEMEQNPSLPAAIRQERDQVWGAPGMVPPLGTPTTEPGEIISGNNNTGEAAWLCVTTVSFTLWAADNGKVSKAFPIPSTEALLRKWRENMLLDNKSSCNNK